MNISIHAHLYCISIWGIVGCSAPLPDSRASIQTSRVSESVSTPTQSTNLKKRSDTIKMHEWSLGDGMVFRDRNGDGIVDWQSSSDGADDGFMIIKEDNDFDGYYEREYQVGGYAFHTVYDRSIHEAVPQIHKIYPPTKVTEKPNAEQVSAPNDR